MPRRIGYARVSTDDQQLDLQLDALKAAGCELIFQEKASGAKSKRNELDKALGTLKDGDSLIVWKMDRLGRSFRHLVIIADHIQTKGAHLVSITEGIDTSSSVGEVIFRLMSVFADFERKVIAERTTAGLRAAKARGRRLGRPRKLTRDQITEMTAMLASGQAVKSVAHRLGVNQSTVFRAKKRA